MLYTIVPFEEIFRADCTADYRDVTLKNSFLRVDCSGKVQRLISTNPADYLNPTFQPNQPYPESF